jgi:hypothetical protein
MGYVSYPLVVADTAHSSPFLSFSDFIPSYPAIMMLRLVILFLIL